MPEQIRFDPNIHIQLETQPGFAPKTVEQDYEVANLMAHVSIEHEERRINKGAAPYNTQMQRKVDVGIVPCLARNKHRVLAENAANRLKMEVGANNDAIVNIAKKAEKTWMHDLGGERVDLINLQHILPNLTVEQRGEVIDSLDSSANARREAVTTKHRENLGLLAFERILINRQRRSEQVN